MRKAHFLLLYAAVSFPPPDAEAPMEMNAYFPRYRALWLAENCTGTMHNLYTLRGAEARNLCADALEQLGYQAESGIWRNAYLTGALELREGNQAANARTATNGPEARTAMTSAMMLDFIRIRTDAEAAANDDLVMNLILTDTGERFAMKRISGVVLVYADCIDENAAATVTCERAQLFSIMQWSRDILETTVIEGDESVIDSVTRYMTVADPYFNIIEP